MWNLLLITLLAAPAGETTKPTGLMVDLITHPEQCEVVRGRPAYSWIVPTTTQGDRQTAYQIRVATDPAKLRDDPADVWDSGRVESDRSVAVPHTGEPLQGNRRYWWTVRTWNQNGEPSDWAEPSLIQTGVIVAKLPAEIEPRLPGVLHTLDGNTLQETPQPPLAIGRREEGLWLLDFGRDAFGRIEIELPEPAAGQSVWTLHLGEKLDEKGRIDRQPPGTVRYRRIEQKITPGQKTFRVAIPPDGRNTNTKGGAILMPPEIGEVMPFRYVELENVPDDWDENVVLKAIHRIAVHEPFDDEAAAFHSSDETLNQVWELCRYSMKATSFAGIYVDGDRERIPYEADAYINQLSHYAADRSYILARRSHEHLLQHGTWPTEWPLHSVLMARADWLYTGDATSAEAFFDRLEARTLSALARPDGLISTQTGLVNDQLLARLGVPRLQDIVDWPVTERDGFDFKPVNAVVNALCYRALVELAETARQIGKPEESEKLQQRAARVYDSFNRVFFDARRGIYVDGEGSEHASLHANAFALACGLVPPERQKEVGQFVASRGMACSVYAAQYLMEALYTAGQDEAALDLMRSRQSRSWFNMIREGSTISMEAWGQQYKPNQDWNHAWGAVPANILSRYVLGVQPSEPGFAAAVIHPHPASLQMVQGRVPTIRGPIDVQYKTAGLGYQLDVTLPANMRAELIPPGADSDDVVRCEPADMKIEREGNAVKIALPGGGKYRVVVEKKF